MSLVHVLVAVCGIATTVAFFLSGMATTITDFVCGTTTLYRAKAIAGAKRRLLLEALATWQVGGLMVKAAAEYVMGVYRTFQMPVTPVLTALIAYAQRRPLLELWCQKQLRAVGERYPLSHLGLSSAGIPRRLRAVQCA